jgi:hypothetical protein
MSNENFKFESTKRTAALFSDSHQLSFLAEEPFDKKKVNIRI